MAGPPAQARLGARKGWPSLAEANRRGSPSTDISSVVVSHGLDTFRLNSGGMIPEVGQSAVAPTEPVLVIKPMHDMQVLGGAVSIMPKSKPPLQ